MKTSTMKSLAGFYWRRYKRLCHIWILYSYKNESLSFSGCYVWHVRRVEIYSTKGKGKEVDRKKTLVFLYIPKCHSSSRVLIFSRVIHRIITLNNSICKDYLCFCQKVWIEKNKIP